MYPPIEEDPLLAHLRHTQQQQASAGNTMSSSQAKRHHSSGHPSTSNRRNKPTENASPRSHTSDGDDLSFFGNTNALLSSIQSFLSVSTDQPQSIPETTVEKQGGNAGAASKRDDENDSLFGLILPKS